MIYTYKKDQYVQLTRKKNWQFGHGKGCMIMVFKKGLRGFINEVIDLNSYVVEFTTPGFPSMMIAVSEEEIERVPESIGATFAKTAHDQEKKY